MTAWRVAERAEESCRGTEASANPGGRWIREFIAPRGRPHPVDSGIQQGNRVWIRASIAAAPAMNARIHRVGSGSCDQGQHPGGTAGAAANREGADDQHRALRGQLIQVLQLR
jgi:hypothetical protein